MQFSGFDWDSGNRIKCQKHGVTIDEITALFANNKVFVGPDITHSTVEERFRAVGMNEHGRMIFIVFTLRLRNNDLFIRPISARYMHLKEVEAYEKAISKT